MQRFSIGDIVLEEMIGNERQVLARIYIVTETKVGLDSKINEIKSNLSVIDGDGNDMIVDLFDTSFFNN
jgi:hypothetical protein